MGTHNIAQAWKKLLRTFMLLDTRKIYIKNSEYSPKQSSASRSMEFLFHLVFLFFTLEKVKML